MNTARDRAILAALEQITDVLSDMETMFEPVFGCPAVVRQRGRVAENMTALRATVEEIRDAIED